MWFKIAKKQPKKATSSVSDIDWMLSSNGVACCGEIAAEMLKACVEGSGLLVKSDLSNQNLLIQKLLLVLHLLWSRIFTDSDAMMVDEEPDVFYKQLALNLKEQILQTSMYLGRDGMRPYPADVARVQESLLKNIALFARHPDVFRIPGTVQLLNGIILPNLYVEDTVGEDEATFADAVEYVTCCSQLVDHAADGEVKSPGTMPYLTIDLLKCLLTTTKDAESEMITECCQILQGLCASL